MQGARLSLVVGLIVCFWGCDGTRLTSSTVELAVEPSSLDFGPTAVGATRTRTIWLKNLGAVSIELQSLQVLPLTFSVDATKQIRLAPGENIGMNVHFSPQQEHLEIGEFILSTDASQNPLRVSLRGQGVPSVVVVTPTRLDFGNVELGASASYDVELANHSVAEAQTFLEMHGDDGNMFSAPEFAQPLVLAPKEIRSVKVTFRPERLATAAAMLQVQTCQQCPSTQVEVRGFGVSSFLEVQPLRIQFGKVPVGGTATQKVTVSNVGSDSMTFSGFSLLGTSGAISLTASTPRLLAPGESAWAQVSFLPMHEAPLAEAWLEVKVQAKGVASLKLPITGEGARPCVVALPSSVDFGSVPFGMYSERRAEFFNRCTEPVHMLPQSMRAVQGGYFRVLGGMVGAEMLPGQKSSLALQFTPVNNSLLNEAALDVEVLEGATFSRQNVKLRGSLAEAEPCEFQILPVELDFGNVQKGDAVTSGLVVQNTGQHACFIQKATLAVGSAAEFSMPERNSFWLQAGSSEAFLVQFHPQSVGNYFGRLQLDLASPTSAGALIPLQGKGVESCLHFTPANLHFNAQPLSCGAQHRTVTGSNVCSAAVTISSLQWSPFSSAEFSLASFPALPFGLNPGGQFSISLGYMPLDAGVDVGVLNVSLASEGMRTLGVVGEVLASDTVEDRFIQGVPEPVDVLFVVDNSGSMTEEQSYLSANFASVISAAKQGGVDFHIGVTTTGIEPAPGSWSPCPGGAEGGEAGRLFPVDGSVPRILTSTTPNADAVFAHNVKVGLCHWDEQGLEAAFRALSAPLVNSKDDPSTTVAQDGNGGFLRENARLSVVVVSDEDDDSPKELEFYETYFRALKGNDARRFQFSAIVAPQNPAECPMAASPGARYRSLASRNGGLVQSICTADWAESLKLLSWGAFGPQRIFPLSQRPAIASLIDVLVEGQRWPSGWIYDALLNAVVFEASVAPEAGATIQVRYPMQCP